MILHEELPARYCGRRPSCAFLLMALSAGGAASWLYMATHHSSSGFGGLAATSAAALSSAPHGAAVEQAETWSPRFRNNTLLCLESARESHVLTWYAGRGGRICAEKVDISGCDAELKLCAPPPLAADGSRTRRQVDLGEPCCGILSVVCRAYYAYAHRCEERLPSRRL
mmetsp:Transcript_3184/g.10741  ORF Transcript_3184/g.10741 Transcript_3184/m.10741 type:complete len:169 (+) Transcript_3184:106-612(+)